MQAIASRLDRSDHASLSTVLDADPVQNAYPRSELRLAGIEGAAWWGVFANGRLRGAVLGGALAVPWIPDAQDAGPLADIFNDQPPRMVVGPRDHVAALHIGRRRASRPRQVRDPQPLLILQRGDLPQSPASPTRRAILRDLDVLTVAAAAMHREEMGIDPLAVDPHAWRSRMATLITRGWSWAWVEDGEVIFKAELSAWTPEVVQIQGVYTCPARRGQGVATAAMAVLCDEVMSSVPMCSLYVNAYNEPAIALYRRLGFRRHSDFATYLY